MAAGRDLLTGADGRARVVDVARIEAQVAYTRGRRLVSLETEPVRSEAAALVGSGTASGFRAAVEAALPEERPSGSVLYQLLDDIPNALLVSSVALVCGLPPKEALEIRRGAGRAPYDTFADLCAGWATGGTLLRGYAEGSPPLPDRPIAPDVSAPDDPLAWHPIDTLPPTGVRRRRRIDAWPDGAEISVEAFFRDSWMNLEGVEETVHEYTVHATVARDTRCFTSVRAEVGALPYAECPSAAASAERLRGQSLESLRTMVQREFTGTTTCTHLNDTLRALEDLPVLVAYLTTA